ncbi:hypothetical protein [Roseinatronobacter ekhonensis]|jgi:hypothetical protein|nr:hypothetical protein [Roseibaca ekhonensis]
MDDPERWLCHYVGGAWRVPFSTRMAAVRDDRGAILGQVVLATAEDVARSERYLRPASAQDDRLYQGLLFQMSGVPVPRRAPPNGILHGAVYLALSNDAVFAIELANRVARAGLPPGAFALLFQA